MCLGIPMEVTSVEGYIAQCSAKGITREVSLFMVQHEHIEPGDHVMVHVGYAIQKMSAAEARTTWELLDETLAAMDAQTQQDAGSDHA
ncbi:hydrogenase assembly chaperone hypC/hupF [Magnetococcus marinus MC-1]|uniref:Hydrogenase assembly chaperone hypC/hupF n=1 Tax=Magnetococcus marinus (strain ATCC BAA-1437 / JCM 17883 / MC-1) TaxID=156889 RepID=A0LAJ7_MAGMM|nr:HypC/HybG/HupF family hydrogenase formation chaperone [Magnetococcus marinus]ABK44990.1 hydrogenase assembly chaperone hypC/hupF [Magnetococcus marinus MC-1]